MRGATKEEPEVPRIKVAIARRKRGTDEARGIWLKAKELVQASKASRSNYEGLQWEIQ